MEIINSIGSFQVFGHSMRYLLSRDVHFAKWADEVDPHRRSIDDQLWEIKDQMTDMRNEMMDLQMQLNDNKLRRIRQMEY